MGGHIGSMGGYMGQWGSMNSFYCLFLNFS